MERVPKNKRVFLYWCDINGVEKIDVVFPHIRKRLNILDTSLVCFMCILGSQKPIMNNSGKGYVNLFEICSFFFNSLGGLSSHQCSANKVQCIKWVWTVNYIIAKKKKHLKREGKIMYTQKKISIISYRANEIGPYCYTRERVRLIHSHSIRVYEKSRRLHTLCSCSYVFIQSLESH